MGAAALGRAAARQKLLIPFAPGKFGWTIWYQGKTRMVCGTTVSLADVPERWAKLQAVIDAAARKGRGPATGTLRGPLSEYFNRLDYRVTTGKPKPLALISANDYKRNLKAFAQSEADGRQYADVPLADFGPDLFTPFASHLTNRAPTSFARIVATVRGFFHYCWTEGFLDAPPRFGGYLIRPPQTQIRDRRLQQRKALDPKDLLKLLEHAGVQERAWLGLTLSGAMHNADNAHVVEVVEYVGRDFRVLTKC